MSERRKENGILFFFSFWGFICHNIVELIEYCLGLQHYKKLFCFLWNIPLRRHSIFGYATCSVLLRIRNIVSGLVLIAHTYSLQTAHSTNFTEFPHFLAAGFVVHSFYLSFYLLIYCIRLHFNWFFFGTVVLAHSDFLFSFPYFSLMNVFAVKSKSSSSLHLCFRFRQRPNWLLSQNPSYVLFMCVMWCNVTRCDACCWI